MKFPALQIGKIYILAFTAVFVPVETVLAQNGGSFSLEEIVVSARKREERLVDVPVSATVISGDTLIETGVENVEDLIGTAPGLYFSSNLLSPGRDFVSLVVRGVGSFNPGEPAVATVIDGAYTPSLGFDTGFVDLERLELLRGPQGTLFGRNTQGGVLNIITRKPDEEFRAKVMFDVDNLPSQKASLAVSGPLGENWFAGASVNLTTTDGYLDNPTIANAIITSSGQTPATRSAQEVDADA